MSDRIRGPSRRRLFSACRIAWAISTIVVVQVLVCAAAILPVVTAWWYFLPFAPASVPLRLTIVSLAAAPSYGLFAVALMFVSAVTTRALGWRTPPEADMRMAEMGWPLLTWVRYMAAIHVVRVFAGLLLRGTPVWTTYLRMSGARLGRRVYVNSLALSDYNLLEFGDDVVIGADAHVAGHTVERGVVKTGYVRLGRRVTVGIGSILDIGVEAADDCQIGALSLVPKHSKLEGGVYVGVPVRRVNHSSEPGGDGGDGKSTS